MYEAPELADNQPFTAASDVFAFGIVVWELITGDMPWAKFFDAQGNLNKMGLMMAMVMQNERPPLTDAQAASVAGRIATKAWEKQPNDRDDFDTIARGLTTNVHVRDEILKLDEEAAREALRSIGPEVDALALWSAPQSDALPAMHERLTSILASPESEPAPSLSVALRLMARARLSRVLRHLTGSYRAADGLMQRHAEDLGGMWAAVLPEYCPLPPDAPDRSRTSVLVIVAGMGMGQDQLANFAGQYAYMQRAGFQLRLCGTERPLSPPSASSQLAEVEQAVRDHRPDGIIYASKGGAYMVGLWRLMEAGSLPITPCVMINVHPQSYPLPTGVPVVLVQGANDSDPAFQWGEPSDPRGVLSPGGAPEGSREHLLRSTRTRSQCFLYYSQTTRASFSTVTASRRGAAHALWRRAQSAHDTRQVWVLAQPAHVLVPAAAYRRSQVGLPRAALPRVVAAAALR